MKLAFVVQRCGNDIRGGAESVCLNLAKQLSQNFEIEILTTCAKDYVSWKNHYDEGIEILEDICIRRFKVDHERELEKFNNLSEKIYFQKHSNEEEEQWMKLQGPYSTKLINFVKNNHKNYDGFVFFTYLYATTYYLLPIVSQKSFLVPFAHDEPPLKFSIYEKIFKSANALIFSTEEEKNLVMKRFEKIDAPNQIIGVGIEPLRKIPENFSKLKINYQYLLYVGRIDESKGCVELIDYFRMFKKNFKSDIKLVLAGSKIFQFKTDSDVIYLGEIDEVEKSYLLHNCVAFVMPSKYESFSVAIMEAWLAKKPVMVNKKSIVLKGHCQKSNAGLYYDNFDEFEHILNLLLIDAELGAKMGELGYTYVQKNYNWKKLVDNYTHFFTSITNNAQKPINIPMMDKTQKNILTFVIPWYGQDLTGGAETLCRKTAERLSKHGINVEVFTTCSKEFLSDWSNFYEEGKHNINGVKVRRFSVDSRNISQFDAINYKLIHGKSITEEEEKQFFKNNINSSDMLSQIRKEKDNRIFVFLPYLYGTTYFGAQICPERTLILPCLHDESYAYMKIFAKVIVNVKGLIFNSTPEKLLAEKIYGQLPPHEVFGVGVDTISSCNPQKFKEKYRLVQFLLYTGRKDPQKNLPLLIDYYCKYVDKHGSRFDLVLTGPGQIDVPKKYLNHIHSMMLSKEELYDAYNGSFVTCQPSLNESFSLSIMESWLCSTPVLVHEKCQVTKDHCMESNGGLFFSNYEEFEECINYFLENPEESKIMAQNGKNYVQNNFGWKKITEKYLNFVDFADISSK